jgi:DNA transposition AAA+ family ATPase
MKIPEDQKHENATAAMNAIRYRIAGDVVNKATADADDETRSALRWLHSYGAERNLSLDDLASVLKREDGKPYSKDSVYQALTGRRAESGASLAPFVSAVQRLRKIEEARAGANRAPFIETTLTRRIWKICETALNFQRIAFIYGSSQIGKTTALEEYQRTHNHGETIYVRMPARGSLGEFTRWIAKSLRISQGLKEWQIKERIFAAIDDRMLLIVDQCHECFRSSSYGDRSIASLLFIMEIFDRCRCGIVLVGTTDFERGVTDSRFSSTLKQLTRRGLPKPLRLPDKPSAENLAEFAAAYGLPPATDKALDLQTNIIRDHDLGVWLTTVQAGQKIASKRKATMTWDHVIAAHAAFLNIAGEGQ